jgi:hypothetical protein
MFEKPGLTWKQLGLTSGQLPDFHLRLSLKNFWQNRQSQVNINYDQRMELILPSDIVESWVLDGDLNPWFLVRIFFTKSPIWHADLFLGVYFTEDKFLRYLRQERLGFLPSSDSYRQNCPRILTGKFWSSNELFSRTMLVPAAKLSEPWLQLLNQL